MPESVPENVTRRAVPGWLKFVAASILVNLGYALYTGHMWEDFFITFQHSRNLCEGNGLVYRPGERVHGFTSPLGTLGLALGYVITGSQSYLGALWAFRILSIAAFAGGGLLLLKSIQEDGASRGALLTLAVLYLFDAKAVAFSMNGMETALMLLFLAWGFDLSNQPLTERWRALGVCWAGLMWTRPDGCVFILVLTLATLVFANRPRPAVFAALLKSGGVCTLLYFPWFAWAWWYYGSPVPHTITAKSFIAASGYDESGASVLWNILGRFNYMTAEVFRPINHSFGGWSPAVLVIGHYLGLFCSIYWLFPIKDRTGRLASLCFTLVCVYFAVLTIPAGWYLPSATVFGLVVLSKGAFCYAGALRGAVPAVNKLAICAASLLCLAWVWIFVQVAWQMSVQQAEIETGNRQQIGLWLRDQVRKGDRVYLEPLGYIGFFSGAKMLDFPGLAAPEVVQVQKQGIRKFIPVGLYLKPEWMVLRPQEVAGMSQRSESFSADYELMKVFDATQRVLRHGEIPGQGYVLFDAHFSVYKRRSPPP